VRCRRLLRLLTTVALGLALAAAPPAEAAKKKPRASGNG